MAQHPHQLLIYAAPRRFNIVYFRKSTHHLLTNNAQRTEHDVITIVR